MPIKKHHWRSVLRQSVLCLLLLTAHLTTFSQSPTVQDCLGAIPVCQPVYYTNSSYTGHGNVYPEIHANSNCPLCMDGEKNDVFYVITVQNSGLLRFTLTPNNPNNDYDWSVFNMTNSDCSHLYDDALTLQVSCNSYGNLGYNGPTGINTLLSDNTTCNGPGTTNGPAFNKDLTVLAGETYLINISNWSSTNQEGYTLDFSSSTANIFDTVAPAVDSIQDEIDCAGSNELYIRFTENMKCISIQNHPEKLSLTGPSGNIPVTGIFSPDCAMGASQSPWFTLTTGTVLGAGSYTLSITGNMMDLCNNTAEFLSYPFTLTEINAPVAGAGNDTTVNNGAIITLHGSASGGTGAYTFHWEPAAFLVDPDVEDPVTINMGASAEFTINVTDSAGCDDQDKVMVTVVGGPLAVTATADPSTVCFGSSATLHAIPTGGSGNYTYSWISNPSGFTSNLQDVTVIPTATTTYTVTINDGFSSNFATVTVTVQPLPGVNAGPDQTLPYGATVNLYGTVFGGSGSYSFVWNSNPPAYYSTEQNPVFVNLTTTTAFFFRATDSQSGCVSYEDEAVVTITGSPLAVNPIATDPVLCLGDTSQLLAMAGGGSGLYTYSWTSSPAGFTSGQPNPIVTPQMTTTYFLTISDGYNQAYGDVTVIVNPVPVIALGPPDTVICIYDSITLDAGNPGCSFYWSNGATTQTILVTTTGIGFDIQSYAVSAINAYSCIGSDSIRITFSFAACTGAEEQVGEARIRLYPNPNHGSFTLSVIPCTEPLELSVENLSGQRLYGTTVSPSPSGEVKQNITLTSLPKGMYILLIKGDRTRSIKKIIIN